MSLASGIRSQDPEAPSGITPCASSHCLANPSMLGLHSWQRMRNSLHSIRSTMESFLCQIYDYLSIGIAPRKADCIFVLAGRQERKVFGIQLWQQGYAPEVILSVGRFEWRRFYHLGLSGDGGLKAMVDRTPPVQRH